MSIGDVVNKQEACSTALHFFCNWHFSVVLWWVVDEFSWLQACKRKHRDHAFEAPLDQPWRWKVRARRAGCLPSSLTTERTTTSIRLMTFLETHFLVGMRQSVERSAIATRRCPHPELILMARTARSDRHSTQPLGACIRAIELRTALHLHLQAILSIISASSTPGTRAHN